MDRRGESREPSDARGNPRHSVAVNHIRLKTYLMREKESGDPEKIKPPFRRVEAGA